MLDVILPFTGGLGLFLVGMMLLSEGLVAFAGGSLQQVLLAFTGRPLRAFASGTLITALAQSSTATTVTLIGFVSAGLITFTQAIGVLIGASLGNTATGWIVSSLGLKISLGFYTLPLIGIGALLKLLSKGQSSELGRALAGFGMLFLGLSMLQEGMQGLAAQFSLAHLPTGGFGAHAIIVLIGLVLTAVLQSSSAAIAMTLTALDAGAINFGQAAAVVVGASIGTTLTGVLVSIGGTVYAKRTAIAYILFNVAAGLIALLLLPLFVRTAYAIGGYADIEPGAIALAAFHSLFIALGALVFLPFTERFAQWVIRLVPERTSRVEHHLDSSLLSLPPVALEASQRMLEGITKQLFDLYEQILRSSAPPSSSEMLSGTDVLLDEAYEFVARIQLPADDEPMNEQRSAQLHAIDHLLRLSNRLRQVLGNDTNFDNIRYEKAVTQATHMVMRARQGLSGEAADDWMEQVAAEAASLTKLLQRVRHELLTGSLATQSTPQSLRTTEIYRWLERTGNHIWRVSHYLSLAAASSKHLPRPAA